MTNIYLNNSNNIIIEVITHPKIKETITNQKIHFTNNRIDIWKIFMFTTFLVPLFMFTSTKETFSKIFSSLSGKRLLYHCSLYIYNK